jgi:hypothetical protein
MTDKPTVTDAMIDRVARAIAPNILFHFDCHTVEQSRRWNEHHPSENDKAVFRLIANDAITVMHQASDTGDDGALLTRLLRHIESLEAHGAGNTERLSFDDLVAIADRLQAKAREGETK